MLQCKKIGKTVILECQLFRELFYHHRAQDSIEKKNKKNAHRFQTVKSINYMSHTSTRSPAFATILLMKTSSFLYPISYRFTRKNILTFKMRSIERENTHKIHLFIVQNKPANSSVLWKVQCHQFQGFWSNTRPENWSGRWSFSNWE